MISLVHIYIHRISRSWVYLNYLPSKFTIKALKKNVEMKYNKLHKNRANQIKDLIYSIYSPFQCSHT